MIIPDVNTLVYAYDLTSRHFEPSKQWLEASLSGSEPVGFAWVALLGFIRVSTNPRIFTNPMPPGEAFDFIEEWLATPRAQIVEPGRNHLAIVRSLLKPIGTAGNLTTDAHLAALAIERNATVVSFDNDFARFPGLRWTMPTLSQ